MALFARPGHEPGGGALGRCSTQGGADSGGVLAAALLLVAALALPRASAQSGGYCPDLASLFSGIDDLGSAGAAICTTTTETSTTTSTTTSGASTTTLEQGECRSPLCEGNGQPWFIKCGWTVCRTCASCDSVPDMGATATTTLTTTTNTTTLLASSTQESTASSTPPPGPSPTPGPSTVLVTTVATIVDSEVCLQPDCDRSASDQGWSIVCRWAICSACTACDYTTTTTSLTFTTSRTRTTRTLTTTTRTFTNMTTTTSTSTRTNTTTTTSRTSSTSTTTTTTLPCTEPSPLFPTMDCRHNITSGGTCTARTLNHTCVEEGELVFSCPYENTVYREPILLSGSYGLRCAVCGLPPAPLNDTDPRAGYVSTTLHFGPNLIAGAVNESYILGYRVYAVDGCNRKLGDALAVVTDVQHLDCCDAEAYSVDVTARVPSELPGGLKFMVVPDTEAGPLPAGVVTNFVMDMNMTVAVGATSSAPWPRAGPVRATLLSAAAAAVSWHTRNSL